MPLRTNTKKFLMEIAILLRDLLSGTYKFCVPTQRQWKGHLIGVFEFFFPYGLCTTQSLGNILNIQNIFILNLNLTVQFLQCHAKSARMNRSIMNKWMNKFDFLFVFHLYSGLRFSCFVMLCKTYITWICSQISYSPIYRCIWINSNVV